MTLDERLDAARLAAWRTRVEVTTAQKLLTSVSQKADAAATALAQVETEVAQTRTSETRP